ncbi:hypothetical protein F5144DRAFT_24796 [Chaetomium tenue]|uniref:Uncharacterized protein n=1 Tax=Chaetomium tenue TaxID=1854479 RepID=A0ACB7PKU2_9PEZI|nr:hypothetical protein F5144DRAFT_24796 [Chaetomium globosum]
MESQSPGLGAHACPRNCKTSARDPPTADTRRRQRRQRRRARRAGERAKTGNADPFSFSLACCVCSPIFLGGHTDSERERHPIPSHMTGVPQGKLLATPLLCHSCNRKILVGTRVLEGDLGRGGRGGLTRGVVVVNAVWCIVHVTQAHEGVLSCVRFIRLFWLCANQPCDRCCGCRLLIVTLLDVDVHDST